MWRRDPVRPQFDEELGWTPPARKPEEECRRSDAESQAAVCAIVHTDTHRPASRKEGATKASADCLTNPAARFKSASEQGERACWGVQG